MAAISRGKEAASADGGDIAITAAVVVSTLREEAERLQCLAVAQMAIRESCAERLQTCPELRDDVRIADARKGAYEAAALRLQGIVEAVLGRAGAAAPPTPPPSRHPLITAALSQPLDPHKRYGALAQLANTKENVPVDNEMVTALRRAYQDVCERLPDVDSVAAVEPLRGLPEMKVWITAAAANNTKDAATATQALLAAIDSKPWPQHQQAIIEAAVSEIRRLGSDAAVRVMLGMV